MTVVLAAAMTYALHLISFPAGWSTPSPARAPSIGTRPTDAAMGSNGTVAVILANKSTYSVGASGPMLVENPAQRLLIVRADGTTTILNSPVGSVTLSDFPTYRDCSYDARNCAAFTRIVVAADGTPFVTFSDYFSGAFSGIREAALVWNGSWHVVQKQKVLHGLAKPRDPDNLSIAAADTPDDYAFTGNYHDSFANEDLNDAARDPFYMADVSGVLFYWGSVGLGLGDATAIRGPFVAGFDGGIKLVGPPPEGLPALALLWRCVQSALAVHPCAKTVLGPGVAYGVDSRGEVVGDDEPQFAGDSSALHAVGRPVLWRGRETVRLSDQYGAAYAIAEAGTIVGTFRGTKAHEGAFGPTSGFIADARERRPHAVPLDPLVQNLGNRHVSAAFGVADDGRILAIVIAKGDRPGRGKLAILTPQ